MPKPFLGFLLQTHEGDLLLPWLHWALLPSQPELRGGCHSMACLWTLFLPFLNFPRAGRGQSSFPKDMEGWTVSTSPARLGLLPVWGQGVLSGLGRPWEPCHPPGHPDYGGPSPAVCCSDSTAGVGHLWDTLLDWGCLGGLPGDLTPGQGAPRLEHPLLCIAGGQCHG